MADLISLAIGYGLTDQETWTMTYAEIVEAIRCRAKQRHDDLSIIDLIVAGIKTLYATAHGVKDPNLEDYTVLSRDEDDEHEQDMSPDAIMERAFTRLKNTSG